MRPLALTLLVLTPALVTPGPIVKQGHKGFEDGTFRGWIPEMGSAHSGEIVTDPVRCGDYAARFEMRSGDEGGPIGGFRSELHEMHDYRAPRGSEVWYGFSTFIPEDWPDLDNRTVISQWHGTPDLWRGEVWRSPPLAIRYTAGALRVTGRFSDEQVMLANDAPEFDLFTYPGVFPKGDWQDWIFFVKWSYEEDGIVQAWLNGVQVIDYRGPIGYNDDIGPWFKWGIYRDDHPETQYLFHDEFRRGRSYEDVDPAQCDSP